MSRYGSKTISALAAGLGLLISATGCTPEPNGLVELLDHALESAPRTRAIEFDLDLSQAPERARWSARATRGPDSANGLLFPAGRDQVGATRLLDIDTGLVTHIELRLEGHAPASASIAWQPEGDRAQSSWPSADTGDGKLMDGDRILTFQLAAMPEWSGKISAIRLHLHNLGTKTQLLKSVRGLRYPIADHIRRSGIQPFRIDLARDTRDAILSDRGRVPLKEVTLGSKPSQLEFAWGVVEPPSSPTRLDLVARSGDDVEVIWTATVPVDGAESRWRDVTIPLIGPKKRVQLEWAIAPQGDSGIAARPAQGSTERPGLFALADARMGPRTTPTQPDILFISVDTLRADRVIPMIPPRPMSPHIGQWAGDHAARFENAVAQASWTLPSHASMLSGLDAVRHGVGYPGSKMGSSRTSVAEVLRSHGYRTLAITEGGWLHPRFGLDQGFAQYRYKPAGEAEQTWLEEMVQETLRGLGTPRRQPMFWFLHTNIVHEYRARWPHGDRKEAYDRAVTALDQALAPLLAYVSSPSARARTLVVLTSDHGEMLGENNTKGHGYLHEANTRIPLLIQLPTGLGSGQAWDQLVRSIDIAPTILDVLGLGSALGPIDGVSLLPLLRGERSHSVRLASTYSSGGDFGLSLRSNRHLKYILLNGTRRVPNGSREQLWRIDGSGGQQALDPSSVSEIEGLRQLAKRRLSETRGLHVHFEPCAERRIARIQPAIGTLDPMAIRTTSLTRDQLHVSEPGGIEVRLAPGESGQLVIEQLPSTVIRFKTEHGEQNRWETEIDLRAFDQQAKERQAPRRKRIIGSSCPIHLIWQADGHQPLDRASAADAEVRRELRALGYLGGS